MKKKIIANAIARKERMITKTVEWKNGSIDVEFSFEPGCEGSKDKWGQLNEPDTPDEYQINAIWFENNDVTKLFDDEDFELIIEKLTEIKEEYDA